MSDTNALNLKQDLARHVIAPNGKRKEQIVIKARYLDKPDEEREIMVAQHLATWGFFEEGH